MIEFENILLEHIKKYPRMQISDVIKLTYQNEFGGGHLIKSKRESLKFLKTEYKQEINKNVELYEDIGNGLVRVYLGAFKGSLRALNKKFYKGSKTIKGNIESFEKKLDIVSKLTKENKFEFNIDELNEFLKEYKKANYPIVSHSLIYKDLYKPSYRIIEKEKGH